MLCVHWIDEIIVYFHNIINENDNKEIIFLYGLAYSRVPIYSVLICKLLIVRASELSLHIIRRTYRQGQNLLHLYPDVEFLLFRYLSDDR